MNRRALTLGAIALTLGLTYGVWYSYSVFLVALLKEFGWSRSVLAGAFSVFTLVHGAANPVIGMLCDRVGPRRLVIFGGAALGLALYGNSFIASPERLYLGFGLLTAVSVALCGWVPAVVLVQRQFMDRLALSLGIVSSGIGLGMLFVVPLCQAMIESLGWRTAWQILGLICAGWIVPANLLLVRDASAPAQLVTTPTVQKDGARGAKTHGAGARDVTLGEAVRTQAFWLVLGAFFFGNICSQTLHVHQVAFLVDHGIAAMSAASVVGVVGIASIFGKTGGGWLADRFEREVIYVIGIAILVGAVGALALVGVAPSLIGAYVFAVMLGVGYSATAALIPAMISDRFRGRQFGLILGMGLMGSAVGSALGPWMAGRLFDATGSYSIPFVIAAVCGTIAAIAGWRARTLRLRAT
ncbi:MAG: MFS transporter [Betaproteobacteria bacterium]|jgi:MFS family permease|nr:MFS transporter [Betaproteobacteria bacterium]